MAEFSDLIAELNKLGKEGNQAAIKEFFDSLSAKTKDLGEKVERLSGTINSSRKVTNETIESDKELITTYDELIKKYKELIELGDEYILQDKESLELLEKRRGEIEKQLEQAKKEIKYKEKLLELSNNFAKETKNALVSLTGISNEAKTFAGRFLQSSNSMLGFTGTLRSAGAGFQQFLGNGENLKSTTKLGKALESVGNFSMNILTSSIDKAIEKNKEFLLQQLESEKQIIKTSGATELMTNVLYESWDATNQYSVSLKDIQQSMVSLSAEVNKFNQMSHSQRLELTNLTAVMSQLDISARDSSKTYNLLTTSMKVTNDESQKIMRNLVNVGAMLGDSDKGIKDFNQSMRVLSAYESPRAVSAFMELEKQAYSTGVEMSKLLEIAGKFDTFEDAAGASAKLNAILGGPLLNSTELLLQTENERIGTIIKSMDASGKHWSTLDKFEKKAIATSVGISDMTEANKLFGQSYADYQKGLTQGQKVLEQQKSLEDRAKEAQTVIDKWNVIVQKLIINLKPLVNVIETILTFIIDLNEKMDGWLLPIFGLLIAKVAIGSMIFKTFSAGLAVMNSVMGLTATVAPKAGEGINKALTSVGSGGAAAFKGLAVMLGISVIMVSVAYSFKILAEAIAILAPHLSTIFEVMSEYKGTLTLISVELLVFGNAMAYLGGMMPLMVLGSLGLVAVGWAIGKLLKSVSGDDKNFSEFISDLSNLVSNTDKFIAVADGISLLKDRMVELNEEIANTSLKNIFANLFVDNSLQKVEEYVELIRSISNANTKLAISSSFASDSIKPMAEFTKEINNLSSSKVEHFERIANSTVRIIEAAKEDNNSREILAELRNLNNSLQNSNGNQTPIVNNINVELKEGLDGTMRYNAIQTPKQ